MVGLTACVAELQELSAMRVPCAAREIEIRDDRSKIGSRSWTAECQGKTYACVGKAGKAGAADKISCDDVSAPFQYPHRILDASTADDGGTPATSPPAADLHD
jgi:hypothetical protein